MLTDITSADRRVTMNLEEIKAALVSYKIDDIPYMKLNHTFFNDLQDMINAIEELQKQNRELLDEIAHIRGGF